MYSDIHSFRAQQFRDLYAGNPVVKEEDIVVTILNEKTMKKEDIVQDFKKQLANTDYAVTDKLANSLVTQALETLKNNNKVSHPSHGYWSMP